MTTGPLPYSHSPSKPPASWSRRFLVAHSGLVFLFLYAPIVLLVLFSFNNAAQVTVWKGFSLNEGYRKLLNDEEVWEATKNSLKVGGLATVGATVMGTMAALALSRPRGRSRFESASVGATRGLLYLPVIVPEIVLAVSLLSSFALMKVQLSLATVVVAHVVFTVSYVAIVVKARLAGLDPSLKEAAADLGAGPVSTFFRITLPLAFPGIAAGALLAFTLSLDDYVVTSLVADIETQTLPVKIYSMLRVGVTPKVNAVCTLLLLFTVVLTIVAQWLSREKAD